ncbi:hypothetical protein TNCV_2954701 [Trichonephila clavipes]|nr:hypothetical protein TNCV_2954701 [Trichonephila clavipes]
MCADDTAIITQNKRFSVVISDLQHYVSMLELWLTDWKIKVNVSKSACFMFTRRTQLPVGLTPVTIFGQPVLWDKELVQSAIDYALAEIKNKRLDSETKLEFERIKLAQLQKQLELANIQNNLLQNSDIRNPSVLETAANINVETLLKSVKTLTNRNNLTED